jgi:hypothetical protein
MQIRCPGPKLAHWTRIPARGYRYKVALVADVNSGGVRMHHLQIRVCGVEAAFQFFSLLAV